MEFARQGKTHGRLRTALCALLLTLLAACGYAGASRKDVQAVSVPVVKSTLEAHETAPASREEIRSRLNAQRGQEMALLESVLTNDKTDEATARSALSQKEELVRRMECEAGAEAVLEGMGYAGALCVCGAQVMTVILPQDQVQTQTDRLRAIEAVCAQTDTAAEEIKIILAKND